MGILQSIFLFLRAFILGGASVHAACCVRVETGLFLGATVIVCADVRNWSFLLLLATMNDRPMTIRDVPRYCIWVPSRPTESLERMHKRPTASPLCTRHGTQRRGSLARLRSAAETRTVRGGDGRARNRREPFCGLPGRRCHGHCRRDRDTGDTSNRSTPTHCRACRRAPMDSAATYPPARRPASRLRIAFPPVARAEGPTEHADSRPNGVWRRRDWPSG